MDLSLVSTEDLVKELCRRLNIEIIVAMDHVAALDYFEGEYYEPGRPEPTTSGV